MKTINKSQYELFLQVEKVFVESVPLSSHHIESKKVLRRRRKKSQVKILLFAFIVTSLSKSRP